MDKCDVHVRTLGLGDHFGATAPPAVRQWSTGRPRAARTLPPGTNATWTPQKRTRTSGFNTQTDSMHLPPALDRSRRLKRQTDEDLDEGG